MRELLGRNDLSDRIGATNGLQPGACSKSELVTMSNTGAHSDCCQAASMSSCKYQR